MAEQRRIRGSMSTCKDARSHTEVKCAGYALGLCFILAVALLWSGSSVLVQYIYKDLTFNSPFFVTYLSNVLFALYLPCWACAGAVGVVTPPLRRHPGETVWNMFCARGICRARAEPLRGYSPLALHSKDGPKDGTEAVPNGICVEASGSLQASPSGPQPADNFSLMQTLRVGLIMCPLWFAANFSYNTSLSMTSVTSSTIISTTSTLWTFVFATCSGAEHFSLLAIAGVLLTVGGSILTGLHDQILGEGHYSNQSSGSAGHDEEHTDSQDDVQHSVMGDAVALFSAMMYGVYTTALRLLAPEDERMSMSLMFGFLGAATSVLFVPGLVFTWFEGKLENLTATIAGWLVLKGLANNVLSDYFWARAVVLTSPTVVTVGLSITIPLAFVTDYVLHQAVPDWLNICAAVCVVFGFGLVNAAGWRDRQSRADEQP